MSVTVCMYVNGMMCGWIVYDDVCDDVCVCVSVCGM